MCRLRSGAEIRNNEDVQNLVTGLIFRERLPYEDDEITERILTACQGRSVDISDEKIREMIQDTLMTFLRTQTIHCYDAQYYINEI